jgi:hypothetical protein
MFFFLKGGKKKKRSDIEFGHVPETTLTRICETACPGDIRRKREKYSGHLNSPSEKKKKEKKAFRRKLPKGTVTHSSWACVHVCVVGINQRAPKCVCVCLLFS